MTQRHYDRLHAFSVFVRVAERGGLTAAARKLGLSTAAVSRALAGLERHLGTGLVSRTTRGLSLTDAGRRLLPRARAVLAEVGAAEAEARAADGAIRGRLRVAGPLAFGERALAPLIARVAAAYPELELDVVLEDRLSDLMADGFDLGLRIREALPDSTLIARRLATLPRRLVAAPSYWARHGRPARPDELRRHAALIYLLLDQPSEWRFAGPAGRASVRVSGRLASNTGGMLVAAAAAGLGVAWLPAFLTDDAVAAGQLEGAMPDWTAEPLTLWGVTPPPGPPAPAARALMDAVAAGLR
jgi:DNA-binding transcriptional LysR family regulator